MGITPEQIRELVDAELSTVSDIRVVSHVRSFLVKPEVTQRLWNYGEPGQKYPCWSVLNHAAFDTAIVYCEYGFGPKTPWGLVCLSGSEVEMSMGMDSGWCPGFLDAYFESLVSTDLPIWHVFKQAGGEYPGTPISEELSWGAAWEQIMRLRAADPSGRYHCHHSIRYGRAGIGK